MSFLKFFKSNKPRSANLAKERLKIIISHERNSANGEPDYLPKLREEIIAVIGKYVTIDRDEVRIDLTKAGDRSIFELNVSLPE